MGLDDGLAADAEPSGQDPRAGQHGCRRDPAAADVVDQNAQDLCGKRGVARPVENQLEFPVPQHADDMSIEPGLLHFPELDVPTVPPRTLA